MSTVKELIQQHCPNGVEYKKLGDLGTFENIGVDKKTIEDICKWCEKQAVYDKLGRYNNFYYKLKNKLNSNY